jgi:hypothetical protein
MKTFRDLPDRPEALAAVLHRPPTRWQRTWRRWRRRLSWRAPLRLVATAAVNRWLARRNLFVVHRLFASSIGEPLCMTPVVHEAHERFGWHVVVFSHHAEIFAGNPHVHRHVDVARLSKRRQRWLRRLARFVDGGRVERAAFPSVDGKLEQCVRATGTMELLPKTIARHFAFGPDFRYENCEIYLGEQERAECARRFDLPADFALIHSEGVTHYTPIKSWGVERFQEVVDRMPGVAFVQVGTAN